MTEHIVAPATIKRILGITAEDLDKNAIQFLLEFLPYAGIVPVPARESRYRHRCCQCQPPMPKEIAWVPDISKQHLWSYGQEAIFGLDGQQLAMWNQAAALFLEDRLNYFEAGDHGVISCFEGFWSPFRRAAERVANKAEGRPNG